MPKRAKQHRIGITLTQSVSQSNQEQRPSAAKRGYGRKWQKARASFLNKYPLCKHCEAKGITEAATVVDHIIPHKGNQQLFWDIFNWQALCKRCHDRKTATEDGGFGR